MSPENAPIKEPWWILIIKWTVIIYAGGAAITFLIVLLIVGTALTSIGQALGLSILYAAVWPLIVLLLFR
jgi:hypothetical protein